MVATQTRIRRGTAAQCNSMTPAADEIISDTTNNRLRIGNGVIAGGIQIPNYRDAQTNPFNSATATGSANSLIVTLSPAPVGYGLFLTVKVRVTAPNTGNAIMNVNSLGERGIKKIVDGSKAELAAGDLNSIHDLVYDGTDFILTTASTSGSGVGGGVQFLDLTPLTTAEFNVDFAKNAAYRLVLISNSSAATALTLFYSTDGVNFSNAANTFRGGSISIDLIQPINTYLGVSGAGRSISISSITDAVNNLITGSNPGLSGYVQKIRITGQWNANSYAMLYPAIGR